MFNCISSFPYNDIQHNKAGDESKMCRNCGGTRKLDGENPFQ